MSIRNYNLTKPQRRFQRRSCFKQNSKPVNYTEIYKLHGIPVHNAEAVKQVNEKREDHQHLQALKKREQMRKNFMKKKQEIKEKKTNNQNKIKPKYMDIESIRKILSFFKFKMSFSLGNVGARELTEENAGKELVPYLTNQNQEMIYDDNSEFHVLSKEMFREIPVNDDVWENIFLKVNHTESSDSEILTFDKGESGGGVIRLDESMMQGTLKVKYDGNDLNDDTWLDCMPHPFHTMWKTVDVGVNGVSITNSHTDNLFVTDVLNRLYQHKEKNNDLAGCCLGYMNKPGQHGYLSTIRSVATSNAAKTNNLNGKKRVEGLRGGRYIVDDLRFGIFGVGSQFIPLNNRLRVKFTKDSSRRFFTGSEMEYDATLAGTDSHFHIANAHDNSPHAGYTAHVINGGQSATNLGNLDKLKTEIEQFKIYYKVLTPSAQIQEDINKMLDVEGKYCNIFYQEIHVRSEVHKLSNSKFTCNNVFRFNCPSVLILTVVRTDYVNGDFFRTPSHCTWEKMKQVVVKVNNIPLPVKIENKQDAYYHT